MTALTAWLPFVNIKNAPRLMVLDAIRMAAREFCAETLVWQCNQDPMTVYVGEGEYAFEPPTGAEVVQAMRGWFNGAPIEPKSQDELDQIYRGSNWLTATGSPRYIVNLSRDYINLVPIPDEKVVSGLTLRIALQPTQDATVIDALLFERHREAIALGAKAKLKLMSEQPFFDAKGGALDNGLFMNKIADERIRGWRGHGSTNMTARNPFGKFA